jgi:hypothetical protein
VVNLPGNSIIVRRGGTESGTPVTIDQELADVIAAWPALPASTRRAFKALASAGRPPASTDIDWQTNRITEPVFVRHMSGL